MASRTRRNSRCVFSLLLLVLDGLMTKTNRERPSGSNMPSSPLRTRTDAEGSSSSRVRGLPSIPSVLSSFVPATQHVLIQRNAANAGNMDRLYLRHARIRVHCASDCWNCDSRDNRLCRGRKARKAQVRPYFYHPRPPIATTAHATRTLCTPLLARCPHHSPETHRPDPYLLGAHRLSKPPTSCLVVEDAPAGVRSGKAAGSKTLGLLTTHKRSEMEGAGADWIVQDLASVKMRVVDGVVEVSITVD